MGKPGRGNALPSPAEHIGGRRRTGGSEPSQYPQEEKATAIPSVAASERGRAQTDVVLAARRRCNVGVAGAAGADCGPPRELQSGRLAKRRGNAGQRG